jgi:enoyl-CoA hydratase/carnithine racemase
MEYIKYFVPEKVATIIINRPDKLNALNRQSMTELSRCWKLFKEDDSAWVALLTGEGTRTFSAGMDIKQGIGEDDMEKALELTLRISPRYHSIYKATIWAIKGYCLGLGWWLAMECDLRIASNDAKFGVPETRLNMSAIFGGLLSEHLPPAIALEPLLRGEPLESKRAYEMGFLNRIVEVDKVEDVAIELAKQICQNNLTSVRRTKELYYESLQMNRHKSISLGKFIDRELKQIGEPQRNSTRDSRK